MALEAREEEIGPYHRDTITMVEGLALLVKGSGKLEEAEGLLRRAAEAKEADPALGAAHPSTLNTINDLAATIGERGNFHGAEAVYRRRSTKTNHQLLYIRIDACMRCGFAGAQARAHEQRGGPWCAPQDDAVDCGGTSP